MSLDYYTILGVTPSASAPEIKDAYRHLVRLHHPDANPECREASEALMKQVLEAYATLGDACKRAHYDNNQHLRAFERNQSGNKHQVFHHPTSYQGSGLPPSLIGKVRFTLGESSASFAAKLGVSEVDLNGFEARDAMPQAALQMRTFANYVERAAQKLEAAQQVSDAEDLRGAYERKKANRNFMK